MDWCADPHADDMRTFAAHVPVVTYAMYNKDADVWPERMRFSLWETEVRRGRGALFKGRAVTLSSF